MKNSQRTARASVVRMTKDMWGKYNHFVKTFDKNKQISNNLCVATNNKPRRYVTKTNNSNNAYRLNKNYVRVKRATSNRLKV